MSSLINSFATVRIRLLELIADVVKVPKVFSVAAQLNAERFDMDGDLSYVQACEKHCASVLADKNSTALEIHRLALSLLSRRNQYHFYPVAAKLLEHLSRLPDCVNEFDEKTEFQRRATQNNISTAVGLYKALGKYEEAQRVLEEALADDKPNRGPNVIFWDKENAHFTPAITVGPRGALEVKPWWEDDPRIAAICEGLKSHHEVISAECKEVLDLKSPKSPKLPNAYPELVVQGQWNHVPLYTQRRYLDDICEELPATACIIKDINPFNTNLPNIVHNSEECTFYRLAPGSKIRLHSGATNARINVVLGLHGCDGAKLTLGGAGVKDFRDGEILAYHDGWDHAESHAGSEDRWILALSLWHPDLVAHPEIFARARGPPLGLFPWKTEYQELTTLQQTTYLRLSKDIERGKQK